MRWRPILTVLPSGLGVGVVAWFAASRTSDLGAALSRIGGAQPGRFALVVTVEFLSVVMMAGLQRHLVAGSGLPLGRRDALALVFSQNAIYLSHPAGPVLANTYAFRQYRRRGGPSATVGWALVTANVLSTLGLVVLSVLGTRAGGGIDTGTAVTALGLLVALALSVGVVQRPDVFRPAGRAVVGGVQRLRRRAGEDPAVIVDRWAGQLATVRLRLRTWIVAFAFAVLNWAADIAAFVLATKAVHVQVPLSTLVVAYGLGQAAQSLPLTPGGLGLVEPAIAAALVHAGVPAPQALAGVLLYRLVSYWGMMLVGWTCWVGVRRRDPGPMAAPGRTPGDAVPSGRRPG
jgi:uncharacterized membrane protein YbhN (UPF0104 family)